MRRMTQINFLLIAAQYCCRVVASKCRVNCIVVPVLLFLCHGYGDSCCAISSGAAVRVKALK